jgi:hypothetical protein
MVSSGYVQVPACLLLHNLVNRAAARWLFHVPACDDGQ